jgi:uncharacterized membrane protein
MHSHSFYKQDKENKIISGLNYVLAVIATAILAGMIYMLVDQTVLLRNLDFSAKTTDATSTYFRAEVIEKDVTAENTEPGTTLVKVRAIDGPHQDEEIITQVSESDRNLFNDAGSLRINKGDTVIALGNEFEGNAYYTLVDVYRLPYALLAVIIFIFAAIIFAGQKGLSSFLGLIVSGIVLVGFIVPNILDGRDPLLITVLGSVVIAFTSLYLAHGFSARTTLALISTFIAIFFAVIMSVVFVDLAKLFGQGGEEALFIQSVSNSPIDLKGILLGAILIGTLGVLDDITTAQTAVVEELKLSNPKMTIKELFFRANSVGREHIAALVNTLVLAYAGASFTLFILLVSNDQQPLWVILNSEFIVEEIIRTIVGSTTLILAVPISTALAAYYYNRKLSR